MLRILLRKLIYLQVNDMNKSIQSLLVLLLITGLSSCYELQSDEELRKDIIGDWVWTECRFPNNLEEQDVTSSLPLRSHLRFRSDGSFSEEGSSLGFCRFEGCDTSDTTPEFCTCNWYIEDGSLVIIPDAPTGNGWLNKSLPIKSLRKNILVFDNMTYNGERTRKICFECQN